MMDLDTMTGPMAGTHRDMIDGSVLSARCSHTIVIEILFIMIKTRLLLEKLLSSLAVVAS